MPVGINQPAPRQPAAGRRQLDLDVNLELARASAERQAILEIVRRTRTLPGGHQPRG
jgi:hypothetical protein